MLIERPSNTNQNPDFQVPTTTYMHRNSKKTLKNLKKPLITANSMIKRSNSRKENIEMNNLIKKSRKKSHLIQKKTIFKVKETMKGSFKVTTQSKNPLEKEFDSKIKTQETEENLPFKPFFSKDVKITNKENFLFPAKNLNFFYLDKVFTSYKQSESEFSPQEFLKNHNIDEITRSKMIDWMIEVLCSFQCSEESLFMAVNLMDRYFSKTQKNLTVQDLHLVGITCMFIACKYEEVFPLKLEIFCDKVAHSKFSKDDIKRTELDILETLEFQINGANLYKILGLLANKLIILGFFPNNIPLFDLALSYFAKMILFEYKLMGKYTAGALAGGVILTALKVVDTVVGNLDFSQKILNIKEIFESNFKEITEISNEVLILTQIFEKTYGNNNLKRFSVDFFLEMARLRNNAGK